MPPRLEAAASGSDLASSGHDGEPLLPTSLQLGIWAPSLADQGFAPFLLPDELERFDAHDKAISRLHIAHLITYSQHINAREKLAKLIQKALRRPAVGGSSPKAPEASQAMSTPKNPSGFKPL